MLIHDGGAENDAGMEQTRRMMNGDIHYEVME